MADDIRKPPGGEAPRCQREGAAAGRRRYAKPRILAREQLEALASDCRTVGKNNFGDCAGKPLKS